MTEKQEIKPKKTEKKEVQKKPEMNEVLMFTPVIETVGTRLKKCREEKKIKLSQVSKALCIRESFLTALEEGEYEVFPALVYAGGFMRSYAIYLGLDDKEVMQQFHKETEYMVEKSTDAPVVTNKNIIPSKKLLLSLLVLIGIGYGAFQLLNKNEIQEPIVEPGVSVSQTAPDYNIEMNPVFNNEQVQPTEPVTESPAGETAPLKEATPLDETGSLEVLSNELKASIPVAPQTEAQSPFSGAVYGETTGARVSLLATNTVWVEVKSEDKVIFTRVLKAGESYNAPVLQMPAVLKTGNAGAVSIYVDGQFKKVLGREGHVLKDIKLIPETFID
ncbi:MAG: DUF4115 domain-containing protein [Alphaproteobacteria bacterium]|nr:DUF4115 domain-containing protein [Alphaproteobacteria bacterium]